MRLSTLMGACALLWVSLPAAAAPGQFFDVSSVATNYGFDVAITDVDTGKAVVNYRCPNLASPPGARHIPSDVLIALEKYLLGNDCVPI